MNVFTVGAFLVPDELLVLVIAASGLCMMVGARKAAASLFSFAIASLVLPVLLVPVIEAVPVWVLWAGVAYAAFLVPFVAIRLFGSLTAPALGKRASADMEGHLARDVAVAMLSAPFALAGALVRALVAAIRFVARSVS